MGFNSGFKGLMWYRSSKAPVGMELWLCLYEFLNSALNAMQWLNLRPDCFTPSDNVPRHHLNRKLCGPHFRSENLAQENSLCISARNNLIPWSSSRQNHHITNYSIRNPEKYIITAYRKVAGCEHIFLNLGFVGPSIFTHSNKSTN